MGRDVKILVCSVYYYYGTPHVDPMFHHLTRVPEMMGHEVDHFDYLTAAQVGVEQMRRVFLNLVTGGCYDAVFIGTHADEFDAETLEQARKHAVVFGWNTDDEWRWEDYSSHRVDDYSFMVTNSEQVYEENRGRHANLLHFQWACSGIWNGEGVSKDIDFSFVGQVYGRRRQQVAALRRVGLQAFGRGSGNPAALLDPEQGPQSRFKRAIFKRAARYLLPRVDRNSTVLSADQINDVWNRSRISFTPLEASTPDVFQVKGRVFEMGLSGTLMLADRTTLLDSYYEEGAEYVAYDSMEDCADKVKFYRRNERARMRIAAAYRRRTAAEHMWTHRIDDVLRQSGAFA